MSRTWPNLFPQVCPCAAHTKPTPRRTPAEAAARYRRLRQLEAEVLRRRAQARGLWLEASMGGTVYRFSPEALRAAMAKGTTHWHRSFWRLVRPPVGSGDHWRGVRQVKA